MGTSSFYTVNVSPDPPGGGFVFALLAGILAMAIGWVMNVVQLVYLADAPITVLTILKIVGIFAAPLGGVLGWVG